MTASPSSKQISLALSSSVQLPKHSGKLPNWSGQVSVAWAQKVLHMSAAAALVAPTAPPVPVLGAPATPGEPPAVAPPATPVLVLVLGAPPAGVLEAPPLGVGCVVLVEPLILVEPPLGSELPRLESSPGVNIEVRPPQPATVTTQNAPSQTRALENKTAISG